MLSADVLRCTGSEQTGRLVQRLVWDVLKERLGAAEADVVCPPVQSLDLQLHA